MADLTSPAGARYRRTFKTREAAELWHAETLLAFNQGNATPPGVRQASSVPTTFGELLDKTWDRYWKDAKSAPTIRCNMRAVEQYFGRDLKLSYINELTVQQFADKVAEGSTPATVNRKLAVLSKMFSYAHRMGWIKDKPQIPRRRESKGRVSFYSTEDIERIHRELDSRSPVHADLFLFLCDTGLRLGEALALDWKDITDERVTVWEQKGANAGSVPLTARAREVVMRRRLFDPERGPFRECTKHTCRYYWELMRGELNKLDDPDFVWHTCRHTFVSRLVQAGVPLKTVKDLARHQDIQTTVRYSHLAPHDYTAAIDAIQ
jgi:integrase